LFPPSFSFDLTRSRSLFGLELGTKVKTQKGTLRFSVPHVLTVIRGRVFTEDEVLFGFANSGSSFGITLHVRIGFYGLIKRR